MIRTMVVGVDGSAYSTTALELAIGWAQRWDAELVGLGIVDAPTICKAQPMPIGGKAYKVHRDATLLAQAGHTVAQHVKRATQRCAEAGVTFQARQVVGASRTCLLREARQADLLVLGQVSQTPSLHRRRKSPAANKTEGRPAPGPGPGGGRGLIHGEAAPPGWPASPSSTPRSVKRHINEGELCMKTLARLVCIGIGVLALVIAPAAAETPYEVWAIDQSNAPGKTFGGTLYIYDGKDLERGHDAAAAVPEIIDLSLEAAALCFTKTGANPVRPHMLAMNASQTHAVISFVASGHVLIMDAPTRTPLDCIRTSVGAGGARQVHLALPAPDETYIAVANQNGKLFEHIDTDYATNTFVLNPAAGINLATCTTPNGLACQDAALRPDNAPICPIIDATSRYVFVTLRGGGLFVVDATQTPMQIVAEYDIDTVHPNGCLGAQVGDKMYVDSGGGTAAHLFGADLYAFPVTGFSPDNPPNVPAPTVVLSDTDGEADAHGATLTKHQRYLWVADRGRNFLWVIETQTDEVVNEIPLAGPVSDDPTPDLLVTSPNGSHVFMSLRGPNPLTADPHVSTGSTPGVGVVKVQQGGRDGTFEALAPVTNVDAGGVERADVHALTIRLQ